MAFGLGRIFGKEELQAVFVWFYLYFFDAAPVHC